MRTHRPAKRQRRAPAQRPLPPIARELAARLADDSWHASDADKAAAEAAVRAPRLTRQRELFGGRGAP